MKERLTKDSEGGLKDAYENLFLELVLKWITVTGPTESFVESVWTTIAYSENISSAMTDDLTQHVKNNVYHHNGLLKKYYNYHYQLDSLENIECSSISYKFHTFKLREFSIMDLFERVEVVGYAVIDLPLRESGKCTDHEFTDVGFGGCRRTRQYYTLAVEDGYYTIRPSTTEEVHKQICTECDDLSQCRLNCRIPEHPVVYYYAMISDNKPYNNKQQRKWHHISIFLDKKEAVYKIITDNNKHLVMRSSDLTRAGKSLINLYTGIMFNVITLGTY